MDKSGSHRRVAYLDDVNSVFNPMRSALPFWLPSFGFLSWDMILPLFPSGDL